MKYLLLSTIVMTAPVVALAEDCSCLEEKVITDACWEFALSSKGDSCQDDYQTDDDRRLTELEQKVKDLEVALTRRVRRLERKR